MSSRRKQDQPQRKRLVNSLDETPLTLTTSPTPTVGGTTTESSPNQNHHHQQQLLCQDILVCGVCQREFALADILKFISHKVNSCSNKENCRINSFNNGDDDLDGTIEDEDETATAIAEDGDIVDTVDTNESDSSPVINLRKQTPSIISSSQRHKFKKLRHHHVHHHHSHHSHSQQNVLNSTSSLRLPSSSPSAPGEKQTVDVHTNTINTEPTTQICCTCKQIFNSSWILMQHAQNVHGLKIYSDIYNHSEPSILPPIDKHHSHHHHHGSSGGSNTNNSNNNNHSTSPQSINSNSIVPSALQLLRMPLSERQFPVQSFIAAAAAAAAGRSVPTGSSHTDLFSASNVSSTLNHHSNVYSDAHNYFGSATVDSTVKNSNVTSGRSNASNASSALAVPTQSSLSFDHHMDFYSQRLRQLAGATSPAGGTSVSPARKLTPPSSFMPMSSSTTRSSPTIPITTSTTNMSDRANTPSSQPLSPKTKSCEFCGKSFRFMSNLIVHRRSHTGEKPFKCHICNHACTQASKLKRHMKTHSRGRSNPINSFTNPNVNCENNTENVNSVPDSSTASSLKPNNLPSTTNGGDVDLIDDDEDIEDDYDVEDEDEEVDDEIGDDVDNGENSSSTEMVAEDLSRATGNNNNNNNNNNNSNNGNEKKSKGTNGTTPNSSGTNNSVVSNRTTSAMQSLLGEVMEKIGLSDIQQYNEAYKQALEESVKNSVGSSSVKQERPSSSSSHLSSENNGGNLSINNILKHTHPGLSPHGPSFNDLVAGIGGSGASGTTVGSSANSLLTSAFDHHNPFDPKRLKLDFSSASCEQRDSLYAGLWLPSVAANPFASFAHHMSAASDSALSAADFVRNKVVDSAFNKTSPLAIHSSSPRPGPSNSSRNTTTSPSASTINSNSSNASPTANAGGTPNSLGSSERRKEHHTRSRNDTCEYCGKVFKNCSNLTVHRRSHTGEKPYKCELCSYACAQSSKLTRHMKTHGRLGKEIYKCRFCGMPFSVPSTLEKHMRKCVVNQNSNSNITSNDNNDLALVSLHHTSLSNTSACSNDKDSDS